MVAKALEREQRLGYVCDCSGLAGSPLAGACQSRCSVPASGIVREDGDELVRTAALAAPRRSRSSSPLLHASRRAGCRSWVRAMNTRGVSSRRLAPSRSGVHRSDGRAVLAVARRSGCAHRDDCAARCERSAAKAPWSKKNQSRAFASSSSTRAAKGFDIPHGACVATCQSPSSAAARSRWATAASRSASVDCAARSCGFPRASSAAASPSPARVPRQPGVRLLGLGSSGAILARSPSAAIGVPNAAAWPMGEQSSSARWTRCDRDARPRAATALAIAQGRPRRAATRGTSTASRAPRAASRAAPSRRRSSPLV